MTQAEIHVRQLVENAHCHRVKHYLCGEWIEEFQIEANGYTLSCKTLLEEAAWQNAADFLSLHPEVIGL